MIRAAVLIAAAAVLDAITTHIAYVLGAGRELNPLFSIIRTDFVIANWVFNAAVAVLAVAAYWVTESRRPRGTFTQTLAWLTLRIFYYVVVLKLAAALNNTVVIMAHTDLVPYVYGIAVVAAAVTFRDLKKKIS